MSASTIPAKRRGHHATKACNGCRRRRCRCDGAHPVCGTCAFYGHECTWSQEEDARRPATKQLVESLRVRIRELEQEVDQLKTQRNTNRSTQSSSPAPQNASGSPPQPRPVLIKAEEEFPNKATLTMHNGTISASGPTSMWSTYPVTIAERREQLTLPLESAYQFTFTIDRSIPLSMQPREVQLSELCRWSHHLPNLGNVQFDRLEHDTLLDRFFSFYSPWLRSITRTPFFQDMLVILAPEQLQASLPRPTQPCAYSPFLHNAIISVATAFSDNPTIRSRDVRAKFASHAKQHLEGECERPTLATIQALGFIADYHGSIGERGLAFAYAGMCFRVTRALGLCVDGRPWVTQGLMTETEFLRRNWQFWSTFCADKIMSLDFGRDIEVLPPHLNVSLPALDPTGDQEVWAGTRHSSIGSEKHQPNNETLVFFETCKLMVLALKIMDTVYSQGRLNWKVTEKESVSGIHLRLESWYHNLPEELIISSRSSVRPVPHIITLNIAYWWLLMILHRPFYARTQRPASHASLEQPPTSFTDLAVKYCDRAAIKIVQLVETFDQCYTMKYFPLSMLQVIFLAGATLLVQTATLSEVAIKKRTDAYEAVQKCIRTLRSAHQTWECAKSPADRLEELLKEQLVAKFDPEATPGRDENQSEIPSTVSSPLNQQVPLNEAGYISQESYDLRSPSHNLAQAFRDFLAQQDPNTELGYNLPAQVPPLQYPELYNLHQRPYMGMVSGSEFSTNPHILPLPFDPNYNAAYQAEEPGTYFSH